MNERMIQNALYQFRAEHAIIVPNIRMPWGESDVLSVTRSGFVYDHEIKISRADFKADFGVRGRRLTSITKALKHDALSGGLWKALPNYFIYVAPVDLLTVYDVPAYAGLLHWHPSTWEGAPFGHIVVVKQPPRLHDRKIDQATIQKMARALMFRYWNQRQHSDPRCPGVEEIQS